MVENYPYLCSCINHRKGEKNTQKKQMKKSIKVKPALEKRLEDVYEVSQQFVSYALSFQRHGAIAAAIRRAALQLGGVYVEEGFVPTCSIERTKDGFRQIFADEVVLTVNMKDSSAELTHRGALVHSAINVTLDDWTILAMKAQELGQEGRLSIPE